jgi:protein SCO1/2
LRVGQGHKVGKFSFQNQDNQTISEKDVKGKIYVAEYFFTTCKSICPIMNKQMQRVQTAFEGNSTFEILSFTVDPKNDGPKQMLAYAKAHGYQPGQWHFITGDKKNLYSLARTSFFVLKPAEAANLGDAGSDFIHTNNFVLVDQDRHIRGYYDGTNAAEVDQLILDIEKLLEPK